MTNHMIFEFWRQPKREAGKLFLRLDGKRYCLIKGAEQAEKVFNCLVEATKGNKNQGCHLSVRPYDCDRLKEGETLELFYKEEGTL